MTTFFLWRAVGGCFCLSAGSGFSSKKVDPSFIRLTSGSCVVRWSFFGNVNGSLLRSFFYKKDTVQVPSLDLPEDITVRLGMSLKSVFGNHGSHFAPFATATVPKRMLASISAEFVYVGNVQPLILADVSGKLLM